MCGIAGFINGNLNNSIETLRAMANTISYRGPDDHDAMIWDTHNGQLGFAHCRLSIIDLSSLGKQPMVYQNLAIVYNGEIYNFKEIRKELVELGHTFISESDTEVILQAFHRWDKQAVHRFIGMFAFAIYDSEQQKVFFFRDRAGVKPFYYYQDQGLILFASELKSLYQHPVFKKKINLEALGLYFQYGYVPTPYSIFENCFKLKPGHYLKIDLTNFEVKEVCYWSINQVYEKPILKIDFEEALQETEELLQSAFKYRMVSDVPVGVFLSGGYDSTAVCALLQRSSRQNLDTFTIGFKDNNYNEAEHAKSVAQHLGTNHGEYYCTENEAKDIVSLLPEIFDEPFADSSAIPTYLVSKIARQHVKVALSADGGDETFGGYTRYLSALRNHQLLSKVPLGLRKPAGLLLDILPTVLVPGAKNRHRILHQHYTVKTVLQSENEAMVLFKMMLQRLNKKELRELFRKNINGVPTVYDDYSLRNSDPLARLLALDYRTYLMDDIMTKVDRATMAVSLEGREPFLDHRVIEYVSRLPSTFKISGQNQKVLLKEIVHKYVPKELMERPKQGFGVPVIDWLRGDLRYLLEEHLSQEMLIRQDLFKPDFIKQKLKEYFLGANENFEFIWFMLTFQMWYKKWM